MSSSRREFIKQVLVGGGVSAFAGMGAFQRLAEAATPNDLYFVFAYYAGGWDILLGLDPRDPAVFNNDNLRQTQIQPGYDQLRSPLNQLVTTPEGIVFGPYIGDLAQHAGRMAVVRGMSMETLTHEAGYRRFLTGKVPSGVLARGSSASTWLASKLGAAHPIPNLSIQVESYNVDRENFASALSANGVPDLVRALRAGNPALDPRQEEQLAAFMQLTAQCKRAELSPTMMSAEGSRKKSHDMVTGGFDKLFDFQAESAEMERIRSHYGIQRYGALDTPEAQAALAAQAIIGGVSRTVSITVASGLDTHFQEWTTDQGPRQMQGHNAVARLAEDLAAHEYRGTGTSWLDHTVILGFSEFSRTALLNTRSGRDHSLTGACYVLGGGIRGGRVIGASADVALEPRPLNLTTGMPDQGGEVPKPEHVIQALFGQAGMSGDPADLRVAALDALFT